MLGITSKNFKLALKVLGMLGWCKRDCFQACVLIVRHLRIMWRCCESGNATKLQCHNRRQICLNLAICWQSPRHSNLPLFGEISNALPTIDIVQIEKPRATANANLNRVIKCEVGETHISMPNSKSVARFAACIGSYHLLCARENALSRKSHAVTKLQPAPSARGFVRAGLRRGRLRT
jgi:hypothetical protein